MNPYYYDELPVSPGEEELLMVMGVILVVLGVIALFLLAFALLRAWGLYTIAKRRGIRHAWLSWIPVGGSWILGSLSDQYQHLAQGKVTSRRKILLILSLGGMVLGFGGGIISLLQVLMTHTTLPGIGLAVSRMGMSVLTWGIGIGTLVFCHICNYDLYRSCDPKNAVVFLVVGIVLPIVEPFFYIAVRKRDDGMPRHQAEEPFIQ